MYQEEHVIGCRQHSLTDDKMQRIQIFKGQSTEIVKKSLGRPFLEPAPARVPTFGQQQTDVVKQFFTKIFSSLSCEAGHGFTVLS